MFTIIHWSRMMGWQSTETAAPSKSSSPTKGRRNERDKNESWCSLEFVVVCGCSIIPPSRRRVGEGVGDSFFNMMS